MLTATDGAGQKVHARLAERSAGPFAQQYARAPDAVGRPPRLAEGIDLEAGDGVEAPGRSGVAVIPRRAGRRDDGEAQVRARGHCDADAEVRGGRVLRRDHVGAQLRAGLRVHLGGGGRRESARDRERGRGPERARSARHAARARQSASV